MEARGGYLWLMSPPRIVRGFPMLPRLYEPSKPCPWEGHRVQLQQFSRVSLAGQEERSATANDKHDAFPMDVG